MNNNKIKIVLFDVDWVIIRPPYYFPKKLENDWYKNAKNIFNDFFKKYNSDLTEWKKSIKKEILPYLEKINWKKGVDSFLEESYKFEYKYLDYKILEKIKKLQKKWIMCYLATSQEKERSEYFLNKWNFKNIFDDYFISYNFWYRKENIKFWEKTEKELLKKGVKTEDVLFFDDSKTNIIMAENIGIKSFLFTNYEKFENDLKNNIICNLWI